MAQQQQQYNWSGLVGKTYEEAEKAIKEDNPDLKVCKVLKGQPVTMDFRPDRVRVIVDAEDIVVDLPCIG